MLRTMLKSKIHRATVTDANIDYEGSVSIDPELMESADLMEFEEVHIWDVTNGARLETYVITGRRGSGEITVNGAAAHLVKRGDLVIIGSYASYDEEELDDYSPVMVFVDSSNKIIEINRKYQHLN